MRPLTCLLLQILHSAFEFSTEGIAAAMTGCDRTLLIHVLRYHMREFNAPSEPKITNEVDGRALFIYPKRGLAPVHLRPLRPESPGWLGPCLRECVRESFPQE